MARIKIGIFAIFYSTDLNKMEGTIRSNIKPGMQVLIILKKDQRTGTLTEGIVKDLLTSAPKHHRGIKVRLQDGQIGRVQKIIDEEGA
jgi:uncharacterized repeat protein (TIGR03833 family)